MCADTGTTCQARSEAFCGWPGTQWAGGPPGVKPKIHAGQQLVAATVGLEQLCTTAGRGIRITQTPASRGATMAPKCFSYEANCSISPCHGVRRADYNAGVAC